MDVADPIGCLIGREIALFVVHNSEIGLFGLSSIIGSNNRCDGAGTKDKAEEFILGGKLKASGYLRGMVKKERRW